ncbi:hypothetical protein ABZ826_30795 [Streptomyces sp. NPDC047515]|uniref:hypothetical protein n=1 Tax=Streptomyces sp. NPDC047515 TaxID=3155380 RepID=UPI0033DA2981
MVIDCGIGAARLWVTLADELALDDEEAATRLALRVNTGDDVWAHGVRVCPDLNTALYALSSNRADAATALGPQTLIAQTLPVGGRAPVGLAGVALGIAAPQPIAAEPDRGVRV